MTVEAAAEPAVLSAGYSKGSCSKAGCRADHGGRSSPECRPVFCGMLVSELGMAACCEEDAQLTHSLQQSSGGCEGLAAADLLPDLMLSAFLTKGTG